MISLAAFGVLLWQYAALTNARPFQITPQIVGGVPPYVLKYGMKLFHVAEASD